MSLFILCYRPHSRLVLLSHVVHLFLVCLHVVLTAVLCLPLCHFLFCVSSLLLSSSGRVDLLVSSSSCLRLCPLVSPLCLVPVLCCPLLSHHHHHCPVMSPLSSRLFHVLCRGLCPLVSSLLLCFVSSSPVSLLSVLLPSCDCVRQTLQSGGSSSTTKHILALESKLTY